MGDRVYNFEEFESKVISKLRILFQNENYNLEDVKKAYFDLTYVNELKYNTKIPITFKHPIIRWYNNDYGSSKSSLSKEMISEYSRCGFLNKLNFSHQNIQFDKTNTTTKFEIIKFLMDKNKLQFS
jgi:hypothetical protein